MWRFFLNPANFGKLPIRKSKRFDIVAPFQLLQLHHESNQIDNRFSTDFRHQPTSTVFDRSQRNSYFERDFLVEFTPSGQVEHPLFVESK